MVAEIAIYALNSMSGPMARRLHSYIHVNTFNLLKMLFKASSFIVIQQIVILVQHNSVQAFICGVYKHLIYILFSCLYTYLKVDIHCALNQKHFNVTPTRINFILNVYIDTQVHSLNHALLTIFFGLTLENRNTYYESQMTNIIILQPESRNFLAFLNSSFV